MAKPMVPDHPDDEKESSPEVSLPRLYYPLCAPTLTPALCLEQTNARFRSATAIMAEIDRSTKASERTLGFLLERLLAQDRHFELLHQMQGTMRDQLISDHASEMSSIKLRRVIEKLERSLGKPDAASRTEWWIQFMSSDANPSAHKLMTSILSSAFGTDWSSVTLSQAKQARIRQVANAIADVYQDLSRCVHGGRSDNIVLVRDEHSEQNFYILEAFLSLARSQQVTASFTVQQTRSPPAFTPAAAPSQVGAHAAATPLPAGWASGTDPTSGTIYYYNQGAGMTQWDAPVGAVEAAGCSAGGRAGSVTQQQQPWQQQQWQQQQWQQQQQPPQPQQQQWQHHQQHQQHQQHQHNQHQHQHQHQHQLQHHQHHHQQ